MWVEVRASAHAAWEATRKTLRHRTEAEGDQYAGGMRCTVSESSLELLPNSLLLQIKCNKQFTGSLQVQEKKYIQAPHEMRLATELTVSVISEGVDMKAVQTQR